MHFVHDLWRERFVDKGTNASVVGRIHLQHPTGSRFLDCSYLRKEVSNGRTLSESMKALFVIEIAQYRPRLRITTHDPILAFCTPPNRRFLSQPVEERVWVIYKLLRLRIERIRNRCCWAHRQTFLPKDLLDYTLFVLHSTGLMILPRGVRLSM